MGHDGENLMQFGLDIGREDLEEDFIEIGKACGEFGVALPTCDQLDVEGQFAFRVEDGVRHELVCADRQRSILVLLDLRVGHRRLRWADHIDKLAIEDRFLEYQLEVDQFLLGDKVGLDHEDAD